MARPATPEDAITYGNLVSARLRELRQRKGWSWRDFADRLRLVAANWTCEDCGIRHYGLYAEGEGVCPRHECRGATTAEPLEVAKSVVYAWERGHWKTGDYLPVDLYPVIAHVYGFRTPTGWLPDEWPE